MTVSTHILDAMAGHPAAGVSVGLSMLASDESWLPVETASTDADRDGRLVGVHYVTPSRNLLKAKLESGLSQPVGGVEEIRLQTSEPFGVLGAAVVAARAVVSRNAAG